MNQKISLTLLILLSISLILINSQVVESGFTICEGTTQATSITMSTTPSASINTETSFTVGCTVQTDDGGACTDFIQHQRATGATWQDIPANYTPVLNARSQGKTLDNSGAGVNAVEDIFTIDGCGHKQGIMILACQVSNLRAVFNVTCNDVIAPQTRNFNQLNFTNNLNSTMVVDCQGQDNTNINDIQLWTNITAIGTNKMQMNQTQNYFGNGNSLRYNTTKTFTLLNVPNGIYKYHCWINDTANRMNTTINYTYTINAPTDSCTPPSINNNWVIKDNCTLTTNTNIGYGNITIVQGGSLIQKCGNLTARNVPEVELPKSYYHLENSVCPKTQFSKFNG